MNSFLPPRAYSLNFTYRRARVRHLSAGASWKVKNNPLELVLAAALLATVSHHRHLIN